MQPTSDRPMNPEIKKEISKCLERSENRESTHQNVWDTSKSVLGWKFKIKLKGKFPAISANIKNVGKRRTNLDASQRSRKRKQSQVPGLLKD